METFFDHDTRRLLHELIEGQVEQTKILQQILSAVGSPDQADLNKIAQQTQSVLTQAQELAAQTEPPKPK